MRPDRRAALTGLLALAAAPRALAQRARVRTVGYLSNGADPAWLVKLLAASGHVEGRNLRLEVRTAPPETRDTEKVAAQLVEMRPDVLLAFGARNVSVLARLTKAIPIVCGGTADPVGIGFAETVRRPGGNITGLSYGIPEIAQILVGLMRTVKPRLQRILALTERKEADGQQGWGNVLRSLEGRARGAGIAWELVRVGSAAETERALAPLEPATALVYYIDVTGVLANARAAELANGRRLASMAANTALGRAGVLMHYSIDHADPQRRVAAIVDQVLRGANPAEIPFELPDRTTFIVNRATAKAIGVELPPEVLARATEIVG